MDRVIRLARLVPEDLRGRLLGGLHEDFERDPDAYRRFFSGFTFDDDGALIEHVRVCLSVEGFPERIAVDAREQSVRSAAALELRRVEAVARRLQGGISQGREPEALRARPPLSEPDRVEHMDAAQREHHLAEKRERQKQTGRRDTKIFAVILGSLILVFSAIFFVPAWL